MARQATLISCDWRRRRSQVAIAVAQGRTASLKRHGLRGTAVIGKGIQLRIADLVSALPCDLRPTRHAHQVISQRRKRTIYVHAAVSGTVPGNNHTTHMHKTGITAAADIDTTTKIAG